ncbi:MAG TPA: DUF948 domain-containing protein [Candidatus Polarisedimenticolia bacterium]|nr:DUF948 domain-containing protein [Candidatus Polarisedimenticolia bacterium]
MEQQLPTALQATLYVGSIAFIALVAVAIAMLLQLRRQIERVVRAVEDVKAQVQPLARETRALVENLQDLSARVNRQWVEVERIMETVRTWWHLVEGISSVMAPPVVAARRKINILRIGLEAFVRAFTNRAQPHRQKARVL